MLCVRVAGAETFRVATYNVENYLDQPTETRSAKLAAAKAKVRESILALKPDVLAVQEMGSTNALLELRDSLKAEGLDLPYWEHVTGFDTNIHVAILSRFPFAARHPHTNDSFLLSGRRFRVSRGFAEVDIQVNTNYSFTLIAAHLKSKRAVAQADEAEMRLEEAKLLREKIDACFAANPNAQSRRPRRLQRHQRFGLHQSRDWPGKAQAGGYASRRAQRRQHCQRQPCLGAAQRHLDALLRQRGQLLAALITSSSAPVWRANGSPTRPTC